MDENKQAPAPRTPAPLPSAPEGVSGVQTVHCSSLLGRDSRVLGVQSVGWKEDMAAGGRVPLATDCRPQVQ